MSIKGVCAWTATMLHSNDVTLLHLISNTFSVGTDYSVGGIGVVDSLTYVQGCRWKVVG